MEFWGKKNELWWDIWAVPNKYMKAKFIAEIHVWWMKQANQVSYQPMSSVR